jgi:hypothetical protein
VQNDGPTHIHVDSLEVTARQGTGLLHVEDVLKGNLLSQDSISYHFYVPDQFLGWRGVPYPHLHAAFFLRENKSGDYEYTSPYDPWLPAAVSKLSESASDIDRVIASLTAVLTLPKTQPTEKSTFFSVLRSSKNPASTESLRSLLNNPDRDLRLTAAGYLLQRNDLSGFSIAKQALTEDETSIPKGIVLAIADGILQSVRNPDAVHDLAELLSSGHSVEIRRAAVVALMHTNSQGAIAPLLSALDDPDKEVRFRSVNALGNYAPQPEAAQTRQNLSLRRAVPEPLERLGPKQMVGIAMKDSTETTPAKTNTISFRAAIVLCVVVSNLCLVGNPGREMVRMTSRT